MISTAPEELKTNIRCHKCGYEWYTKSKLSRVTCPNIECGSRVKNPNSTYRSPIESLSG